MNYEWVSLCVLFARAKLNVALRILKPGVRSVSIFVRERPRTFGNLANHSSPISERSRSFANKTAYWTHCMSLHGQLTAAGRFGLHGHHAHSLAVPTHWRFTRDSAQIRLLKTAERIVWARNLKHIRAVLIHVQVQQKAENIIRNVLIFKILYLDIRYWFIISQVKNSFKVIGVQWIHILEAK